MKLVSIGLLCFLALFVSSTLAAQDNVAEMSIKVEKKVEKNGFQMTVNASKEIVALAVEKKLKNMGVRYDERKGTYTAKAANIGSISTKAIDFTLITDENRKSKTTSVAVVVAMGYDVVVNSRDYATESQNIRGFLTSLRDEIRVEALNARIKEESEKLADLERALKKMTDRKNSLEKDIQEYLQKIDNAKTDAAKAATEMENLRTQVENQRQNIEKIKKEL